MLWANKTKNLSPLLSRTTAKTCTLVKVQIFQNPELFEIQILKFVVCLQIINNFKLNSQLSLDELKNKSEVIIICLI